MSENLEALQAETVRGFAEMRAEMREGFRSVLGEIASLRAEGLATRTRVDLLIDKLTAPAERDEFAIEPPRIAAVR